MGKPNSISLIYGTDADEDFIGSARAEWIWGFGGRDRIYAKAGNDRLFGGDGNDILDGGEGRDLMYGGSGDDKYKVDDPGDVVSEQSVEGADDGGIDTVESSVSFTLGAGLERLTLTGGRAINGVGNTLDNYLRGNDQKNILSGGDGSDKLFGYGGDDILVGGAGRDYMTGGAGADTFVLRLEPGEWDRIYDLNAEDWIGIEAESFGLSEGNGLTGGVLDADHFVLNGPATAIGHGQFIFNSAKRELLWDADGAGSGRAVRVALIDASAGISSNRIISVGTSATISIAAFDAAPSAESSGSAYVSIDLSSPLAEDVVITLTAMDGSAIAGQDYVAPAPSVTIAAGATTFYLPVELIDDSYAEWREDFTLRIDSAIGVTTGTSYTINPSTASVFIVDEGPCVVAETMTAALGITDPSAIAYDVRSGHLIVADSEVDEAPFYQAENLFALGLDGSLVSRTALGFTREPTGLASDPESGRLYITDDDEYRVFSVNADNPNQVLWDFDTTRLGGIDPEDIAYDPVSGHLFICNGLDRKVIEVDIYGTQTFSSFVLPQEIIDPEALAYDAEAGVFYVGGGFSSSIWKVDRGGEIIDVITVLDGLRAEGTGRRVSVKDLELAPASDGSGEKHLYVADFGWSHEADGRIIEIDLGDGVAPYSWELA